MAECRMTLADRPRPAQARGLRAEANARAAVLCLGPQTPAPRSCENRGRMEHAGDDPSTARPGTLGSSSAAPGPPHGAPSEAASPLPEPGLSARLRRDLRIGVKAGLQTFWELARVMIPAYGITLVLERLGVIQWLAHLARPLMSLLGLPGDAAVPLMVGYVLNIYAAVGAMQALHLSAQQITVLAIAILIGHNLLVEGAVLHRAGMNGFAFGALRVVAGLAAAAVANLLMGLF
jgi:spore maturation protein SpmB